MSKEQVRDKILEYHERVLKPAEQMFTRNKEADMFIREDPATALPPPAFSLRLPPSW